MRLTYIHHLAGDDPAINHAREFTDAVRALGHTMSAHALNGTHGGSGNGPQTRVGQLRKRLSPYLHEAKSLLSNPQYVRRQLSILRAEKPDVLIARHHYLDVSPVVTTRLTHTPLVLEVNSPTCERHLFPNGYVGIPYVDDWMEAAVLRSAARILVVTGALGRFLANRHGLDPDKIIVNHNGAHINERRQGSGRNRVREQFGLAGKKVVGFAGGLQAWRRPDLLVDIIKRLAHRSDIGFLLVGDGPDWIEFRKRLAGAGLLERVALAGRVDHAVIAEYLSAMDVALLPASAFYMSPLKLFEYMAAGVATVAPRCEAIEEIVSDGETALLFTQGHAEEAVKSLLSVLDDEPRRHRIGEAAARRVQSRFTWRHNADRAMAACQAAMGSGYVEAVIAPERPRASSNRLVTTETSQGE